MNVKKLMLVVILFLLFSCGDSEKIEIDRAEYDKLKGVKKSEYPKELKIDSWDYEIVLGSDNHEYAKNNGGNAYMCFHYIDCKLCAKRNKK